MSRSKPNPAEPLLRWFVFGPLGPLGRKLGFRWVFFFTLPIPYHPLLFPALLLALLGWAGWSAVQAVSGLGGGHASWAAMLAIGLAMAVPLSIPIIAWVMMAFRGQLLQGENASFTPIRPEQMPVALAGFDWVARDLIKLSAVARLYAPPLRGTVKAKAYHWLTPSDAAALRAAMPCTTIPGWKFEDGEGHVLLVREGAPRPDGTLVVRTGKHHAPLWLVTGLQMLEARGPSLFRRVTFGKPAIVGKLPLFVLFHWTALVGKSEWVIGFPRRVCEDLLRPGDENARSALALFAPRDPVGGPFDKDGLPALFAEIADRKAELDRQHTQAVVDLPHFWEALAAGGNARRLTQTMDAVLRDPDLLTTDNVPTVLDWLERERDMPRMQGVHAAARLLAAFPDDLLAPHTERLGKVFNSQKLALQWELPKVEDRTTLPTDAPLFAGTIVGFGLYLVLPGLYARLAAICPDLKNVERGLQREMDRQSGIRHAIAVVFSGGFATKRTQTPPPSP